MKFVIYGVQHSFTSNNTFLWCWWYTIHNAILSLLPLCDWQCIVFTNWIDFLWQSYLTQILTVSFTRSTTLIITSIQIHLLLFSTLHKLLKSAKLATIQTTISCSFVVSYQFSTFYRLSKSLLNPHPVLIASSGEVWLVFTLLNSNHCYCGVVFCRFLFRYLSPQ